MGSKACHFAGYRAGDDGTGMSELCAPIRL